MLKSEKVPFLFYEHFEYRYMPLENILLYECIPDYNNPYNKLYNDQIVGDIIDNLPIGGFKYDDRRKTTND